MSRRTLLPGLTAVAAALLTTMAIAPVVQADDDKGGFSAGSSPTVTERRAVANAALAKAEAIFDGTAPAADKRAATVALRDLRVAREDLAAADQAAAEALLARPGTNEVSCSATTCVHWATGVATPEYVATVLDTVDDVRASYVAAGYRSPLPDGTAGGGSNLLDIYLEDSGDEGLYGYCTSDDPKLDDPTPVGYDVSAYCGLDNDFDPNQFGGAPALDSLQVTVAHEYFHAVQFAYDFLEDGWFMEATAAWVEDEVFDAVNDNYQYLFSSSLSNPARSLDEYGDSFHYGAWIFFRFLSERFAQKTGELGTIVRDIWEYADGSAAGLDYYSTAAVNKALADRGTSIRTEFARFAVANRVSRTFYAEGDAAGRLYPVAPATSVTVKSSTRNPSTFARTLDHLESSTVRYVPSYLRTSDWKLRLDLDLASKSKGSMAAVKVFRRNGTTTTKYVTLNSKGDARVTVGFSSTTVKAVEVTLINSSPRFGDCWVDVTDFSCSGRSLDDNLRQTVNPIAYRS
ncbi:MAG: hypothetical protein NTX33_17355 [Propionibacteriales bacterium]|nr:hypothetical protein [Propionibacteriales bacterium]